MHRKYFHKLTLVSFVISFKSLTLNQHFQSLVYIRVLRTLKSDFLAICAAEL